MISKNMFIEMSPSLVWMSMECQEHNHGHSHKDCIDKNDCKLRYFIINLLEEHTISFREISLFIEAYLFGSISIFIIWLC